MVSGLFDRHPNVKLILGHCAEGLPFSIDRTDQRMRHFKKDGYPCDESLRTYLERNVWVSTAGVTSTTALQATLDACGEDRVLWSVDYPYESYEETGHWFDHLELNGPTRGKLGWENARALFKLDRDPASAR